MKKWPNTQKSQKYEINEFIKIYKSFSHRRDFTIENAQREKPDCIVKDIKTNEKFGIELTSVYLNDRSVPDLHMVEGIKEIPDSPETVELYKNRIIEKIKEKIEKAKREYSLSHPLILAIYANEYITIHMEDIAWDTFAKENIAVFDSMEPFVEIVFWSLGNGKAFSITK